jgi:hypothetical protein
MSKISEQKALGAYPKMSRISETHRVIPADNKSHRFGDANEENREAFIKGYDQAIKDFLEKAEEFLYLQLNNVLIECGNIERLIEQFKNYMQNE